MSILNTILVFLLAYLLGSIPTAVWVGKRFHKIDVRQHGSGNAGTTNVIRVLGWKTGIPVLIIDIAKGWLAAMLPLFLHLSEKGSSLLINLQIVNEISILIHPLIVREKSYPMFSDLTVTLKLKLKETEQFENGCVWMAFTLEQ